MSNFINNKFWITINLEVINHSVLRGKAPYDCTLINIPYKDNNNSYNLYNYFLTKNKFLVVHPGLEPGLSLVRASGLLVIDCRFELHIPNKSIKAVPLTN